MRSKGVGAFGRKELMAFIYQHVAPDFEKILVENSLYLRKQNWSAFIKDIQGHSRPIQGVGGMVVKVSPTDCGHQSHWCGLLLEVFSERERLDGVVVHFDRALERAPDDRPDYTSGLHIWLNAKGEEDWYIARPKSLDPLALVVNQFVNFWCQ